MTIRDKIKEFIQFKDISDYKFEKSIGKCKSWWGSCKNPTSENVKIILEAYPDLSAEWLFRGEGEMLRSDTMTTTPVMEQPDLAVALDAYKSLCHAQQTLIEQLQRELTSRTTDNIKTA